MRGSPATVNTSNEGGSLTADRQAPQAENLPQRTKSLHIVKHFSTAQNNSLMFDHRELEKTLQRPDWYSTVVPLLRQIERLRDSEPKESKKLSRALLDFVHEKLEQGRVFLGTDGPNWDAERKPIDTIVIHHIGRQPGMTLAELNALHLLRLYAAEYFTRESSKKNSPKPPIYSRHFRDGKQVFFGYHWLLRMDGTTERLLDDSAVGWHAANWEINCRSVAFCLDNDYEQSEPTREVLQSLAECIRGSYPSISSARIIGHCEANKNRTCPGALFLPSWKEKLLTLLQ